MHLFFAHHIQKCISKLHHLLYTSTNGCITVGPYSFIHSLKPCSSSSYIFAFTSGQCPYSHLLHCVSTVLAWRMDGEVPNVNEFCAGCTQPARDLVSLSLHILAFCLYCMRGLCWTMPLFAVKFKLDALNSKPIFFQCQPRVLVVVLALWGVPPISCTLQRLTWQRESERSEMNANLSSTALLRLTLGASHHYLCSLSC